MIAGWLEGHPDKVEKLVRVWIVAIVLPGLAAFAWEISYLLRGDDLHGVALWLFGAYAVGAVLWAALRLKMGWRTATLVALATLALGYDVGFFIASAGPISLFPAMAGLGGIVSSTVYGRAAAH